MRTLAVELAPHNIRCNSVHPGIVDTPIIAHQAGYELFTGIPGASREVAEQNVVALNALKIPWVEAVDTRQLMRMLRTAGITPPDPPDGFNEHTLP
jgi:(+)-trans-carveol dehydrogenase